MFTKNPIYMFLNNLIRRNYLKRPINPVRIVGVNGRTTIFDVVRSISLAMFLLYLSNLSFSEVVTVKQWTKQFGTASDDFGNSVTTDKDGNIYISGGTNGGLDGNINTGGRDIFLIKYDSSGTKQWTKQYGTINDDFSIDLTNDSLGNIYTTGRTWGSLDGNNYSGDYDIFLTKFESSGEKQWTNQFGSIWGDAGVDLLVAKTNNIYITGFTNHSLDNNLRIGEADIFLTKYDSTGTRQWTKQFGSLNPDNGRGITEDSLGNLYITGDTNGNLENNNSAGSADSFLIKYDNTGISQWTKQFGTPNIDYGESIGIDSLDNIYIGGYTQGGLDGNYNYGGTDIFLIKYDNNGNRQWTNQFGTGNDDQCLSIALDSKNYIYITGYSQGGLDGNYNYGNKDIFLSKFNNDGTKQWTKQIGTSNEEQARDIIIDNKGNLYVTGYTAGGLDGNINAGGSDIFLIKFSTTTQPELSWMGESGYTTDGVDNETGTTNTTFTFRVKYTDADNDAPTTGFPKLYLKKSGTTVPGSPFTMSTVDSNPPATGKIYSISISNLNAGSYTYYFEAYDQYNALAVGVSTPSPTVEITGPVVYISTLTGKVTQSDNNIAVNGAKIELLQNGSLINQTATDTAGNYIITTATGTYSVRISKPGYQTYWESTVYLPSDVMVTKNVNLSPFNIPALNKYWTRQFGTSLTEGGLSIVADTSTVYLTGLTAGGLDGNTNTGSYDIFLTRYNTYSGTKLWTHQFGTSLYEEGRSLAIDSSGSYLYITGYTLGNLDGNLNLGESDVFLTKYDVTGTKLWTRQFGTTTTNEGYAVTTDKTGNVYVTGYTTGGMDGNTAVGGADGFLVKYDTSGTKLWTRQFGTTSFDVGRAVATDNTGNIYVTGVTAGKLDNNDSVGGVDVFLTKYDTTGTKLWTRQFGTITEDWAYGITTDSLGNVYLTGYTAGTLAGHSSNGNEDIIVVKYDTDGNKMWTSQVGTSAKDWGYSITTENNILYITGYTSGGMDNNISAGAEDIILLQYDTSGVKQTVTQIGTNNGDWAYAVCIDKKNNVYLTGVTVSGLDNNSAVGENDVFILKYGPPGGVISGRATRSDTNAGVPNAKVEVYFGSENRYTTYTETDGTFRVPEIIPGTYDVYISSTNYDTWVTTDITVVSASTTTVNFILNLNLPAMPTGFKGSAEITNLRDYIINWEWKDNANNEIGYRLINPKSEVQSLSVVADLSANATYFIEPGLKVNTSYYRYLEVYNNAGTKNTAYLTTFTLANPPLFTKISTVTTTQIVIQWSPNGNSGWTQYQIFFTTNTADFVLAPVNLSAISTLLYGTETTLSYQFTNLSPGTTYWLKIRAVNGDNIPTPFDITISTSTLPLPIVYTTGKIYGKTTRPDGISIPGVQIELLQNGVMIIQTITDGSGIYKIDNIPPGIYDIQTYKLGYSTARKFDIPVNAGDNLSIDLNLTEVPAGYEAIEPVQPLSAKIVPSQPGEWTVNPDKGESAKILFKGPGEGKYVLRIFNLVRELVYEEEKYYSSSDGWFDWIPIGLPNGGYIVTIQCPDGKIIREKFAIVR